MKPPTTRDLVVDAIACYRITRLVTADTITRPWRVRIIRAGYDDRDIDEMSEATVDKIPHQDADAPKRAAFVTCPYCVGMYVAAGVIAARQLAPRAWDPCARVLVAATAAALGTRLEKA